MFDLEHIGRSAGIFDPEKLLSLNADHIRAMQPDELVEPLQPFLKSRAIEVENRDILIQVIETLHARSRTLEEMAENALFYFANGISYEEKTAKKFLKPAVLEALRAPHGPAGKGQGESRGSGLEVWALLPEWL